MVCNPFRVDVFQIARGLSVDRSLTVLILPHDCGFVNNKFVDFVTFFRHFGAVRDLHKNGTRCRRSDPDALEAAGSRTVDRGPGQPLHRVKRVGVTPLNSARNKNARTKTTRNLPVFRPRYKCTNAKKSLFIGTFRIVCRFVPFSAQHPLHTRVCVRARKGICN